MNILTGLENFLRLINDNWTTILVIAGLIAGIYKKIQNYIGKSDEEKYQIAKEQISEIILHMITDAENDYAEWNKAGSIKRSQVIAQIYAKYPILAKMADQESVINFIDDEIDGALKNLRNIMDDSNIYEGEEQEEAE